MKRQITADEYRIKPDACNSWALCKPAFKEDGTRRTDKDGNPYYAPFQWSASLQGALRLWVQFLLMDKCDDKAADVADIIKAVERVEGAFVVARTNTDAYRHGAISRGHGVVPD